jgi:predicted acyltransferase
MYLRGACERIYPPSIILVVRYLSIDFYRGLTIALMLIVNTPGSWQHVYSPLLHAEWSGCTPTDLVFPSFMFIIGVSMWFSFEKYGRRLNRELGMKVLKRTVILFALGLLLAKFPFFWKDWDKLRFLGVLPRLALGYGLASLLALTIPARWLPATAAGILLGYWGLLYAFAEPGQDPYGLLGNVVRQVDLAVMGQAHMWQGKGVPFDPEGILSTLPAIVTVLLGWWSGQLMQRRQEEKILAVRDLLLCGVVLAGAGLAWDLVFPINKSLWTSSFVLYTGGISMILLAFSVWALDIADGRRYITFFLVFGANPLFAYVLAGLLTKTMLKVQWMEGEETVSLYGWISNNLFRPIDAGQFGSLLFALTFMLICWSVCFYLYRRKIYVKI